MTSEGSSDGVNQEDLQKVRDSSSRDEVVLRSVETGGGSGAKEVNSGDDTSSESGVRNGGDSNVPRRLYSAVVAKLPKISKLDVVVEEIDGEKVSMIPDDIFEDVQPIWSDILIGRFVDKAPYLGVIHKICKQIWAIGGIDAVIEVYKVGINTVKFVIRNQATRVKVLRRRVWHIAGIPMTVEKCAPQSEIVDEVLTIVPLWVTLKGVPRELFNHKGLSYLASRVGEPKKLHMDTELCMKFDEAKVLVDVDLNGELPKSHRFRSKRGLNALITFSYPWLSMKCSLCSRWGHSPKNCTSHAAEINGNGGLAEKRSGDRGEKLGVGGEDVSNIGGVGKMDGVGVEEKSGDAREQSVGEENVERVSESMCRVNISRGAYDSVADRFSEGKELQMSSAYDNPVFDVEPLDDLNEKWVQPKSPVKQRNLQVNVEDQSIGSPSRYKCLEEKEEGEIGEDKECSKQELPRDLAETSLVSVSINKSSQLGSTRTTRSNSKPMRGAKQNGGVGRGRGRKPL